MSHGSLAVTVVADDERYFWILPIGFTLMALTPYLFFGREGRRRAGLRLPERPLWILWGVLLGAAGAALCYGLGVGLFGESEGGVQPSTICE